MKPPTQSKDAKLVPAPVITAHELARKLLKGPDLPVWGEQVGQGGGEGEDWQLWSATIISDALTPPRVYLEFGPEEMWEDPK